MTRSVIVGGLCGLAWAGGLRGWMAQLAGGLTEGQPEVTWMTFWFVLLPGTTVGVLLGCSAQLRRTGRRCPRVLIFSPVLFAAALADPAAFMGLITNGTGGGSLMVIATALAIGFAITRPRWTLARALCAVLGGLGVAATFGVGGMAAPLSTPHGLWVGVFGATLVLVLGIASALPYAPRESNLSCPRGRACVRVDG